MTSLITISEVNSLNTDQFELIFGNVIELCTDAAVQVGKMKPFNSLADLCDAFQTYLDDLSEEGEQVLSGT